MLSIIKNRKASPDWVARQQGKQGKGRHRDAGEMEVKEKEPSEFTPSSDDEDDNDHDLKLIEDADLTDSAPRKRAKKSRLGKRSHKGSSRRRRRATAPSPEDTEDETEIQRDEIVTRRRAAQQTAGNTSNDGTATVAAAVAVAPDATNKANQRTQSKPSKTPPPKSINSSKLSPEEEKHLEAKIICGCETCKDHRRQAWELEEKQKRQANNHGG
ncbi:hypothetical protein IWZ01DRAFT_574145 [Phyllosticta capitalensis]